MIHIDLLSSRSKTLGGTFLFVLAGICGALFVGIGNVSLPLAIFYIVITVNTYFSIRLFSQLVPKRNAQQLFMDALLVLIYGTLAFTFNDPTRFALMTLVLFVIATIKYVLMKKIIDQPDLLRRKIAIDISGIVMGSVALIAMVSGHEAFGSWFLAVVFGLANIYLLFIKPMYRI